MAFVDLLNKTSEIVADTIGVPEGRINVAHRCVVLDNISGKCEFVSVFKRIESHFTQVVNSDVVYLNLDSRENFDCKSFLNYNNSRLFLAVVCNNSSALDWFLDKLYSSLTGILIAHGGIVRSILKLNVFFVFQFDSTKDAKENQDFFISEAQRLSSILAARFENNNDKFPDCSVVFKLLIDNNDIEKIEFADELYNLHINSFVQSSEVNALYVDHISGFLDFTEDKLPWVAYKMQETYIPEQIIFRSIYNRYEQLISVPEFYKSITEVRGTLVEKVRKRIYNILKINDFITVEEMFSQYKELFPVETTESEWENRVRNVVANADFHTKNKSGFLNVVMKLFGRSEEKSASVVREVEDYIKVKLNDNDKIVWSQYVQFVKNTISPSKMCSIVFNSLSEISLNIDEKLYSLIKEGICKIVNEVFNSSHPVWDELKNYYIDEISDNDKNIVESSYANIVKVCSKLQKTMFEQIDKWVQVSASSASVDFSNITINGWDNPNEIIDEIIKYLENKKNDENFIISLKTGCSLEPVIIISTDGFIPMTNSEKFEFALPYDSPSDKEKCEYIAKNYYKRRRVRYKKAGRAEDISLI